MGVNLSLFMSIFRCTNLIQIIKLIKHLLFKCFSCYELIFNSQLNTSKAEKQTKINND